MNGRMSRRGFFNGFKMATAAGVVGAGQAFVQASGTLAPSGNVYLNPPNVFLSRIGRKVPVRFLGEGVRATPCPYPTRRECRP
jgi:hypothetical protein